MRFQKAYAIFSAFSSYPPLICFLECPLQCPVHCLCLLQILSYPPFYHVLSVYSWHASFNVPFNALSMPCTVCLCLTKSTISLNRYALSLMLLTFEQLPLMPLTMPSSMPCSVICLTKSSTSLNCYALSLAFFPLFTFDLLPLMPLSMLSLCPVQYLCLSQNLPSLWIAMPFLLCFFPLFTFNLLPLMPLSMPSLCPVY